MNKDFFSPVNEATPYWSYPPQAAALIVKGNEDLFRACGYDPRSLSFVWSNKQVFQEDTYFSLVCEYRLDRSKPVRKLAYLPTCRTFNASELFLRYCTSEKYPMKNETIAQLRNQIRRLLENEKKALQQEGKLSATNGTFLNSQHMPEKVQHFIDQVRAWLEPIIEWLHEKEDNNNPRQPPMC